MRFKIDGVFAKCAACEADDFYPALALNSGRRDVYICAACGHEIYYPEWVAQIRRQKESARKDK